MTRQRPRAARGGPGSPLPGSRSTARGPKRIGRNTELALYEARAKTRQLQRRLEAAQSVARQAVLRGKRLETTLLELRATLERAQDHAVCLEQVNAQLQAFACSAADEMRAPIRAVCGFSEAVMEDYAGRLDETGQDYLVRLQASARWLDRMVVDLLQHSALTRKALRPVWVNLCSGIWLPP